MSAMASDHRTSVLSPRKVYFSSYLQQYYWAVIGTAIAIGTLAHLLNRVLAYRRSVTRKHVSCGTHPCRLRNAAVRPPRPRSIIVRTYEAITTLTRAVNYLTPPPLSVGRRVLHFRPLGPVLIVLGNLIVVLVLCFWKEKYADPEEWEQVGYRTGYITVCQLPLVFLLAGRQNIIGYLTGMGYERLNWFHHWIARTMWLTATIHMGFWFHSWSRYGYIEHQLKHDEVVKYGFSSWCVLTFIVLTSAAPIRNLGYEFFVIQHLVSFVGLTSVIWFHVPAKLKQWVWLSIGLLIFDRVIRYAWATFANLSIFHRSTDRKHRLWANRATFTPLPGDITRIKIDDPVVSWKPGQHVFFTCHSVLPLQSHPFTIASIPADNKMEFVVRAEKGGTRRFHSYASEHKNVLNTGSTALTKGDLTAFIDGPYGSMRTLRQFDSVVLLAGGMGATFMMPCLRDIVAAWKTEASQRSKSTRLAAVRRVRFIWVIRSLSQLICFETQLQSALADVAECQHSQPDICRDLDISIYVTSDEELEPPATLHAPMTHQNQSTAPTIVETGDHEKMVMKDDGSVRSVSESSDPSRAYQTQKCYCSAQADEKNQNTECTCSGTIPITALPSPPPPPAANSAKHTSATEKRTCLAASASSRAHPTGLNILSGRPHPRTAISQVRGRAEGEIAVAVCGPRGLSDDVRRSVVALSDARGMSRGTQQGIYLHVEMFGW